MITMIEGGLAVFKLFSWGTRLAIIGGILLSLVVSGGVVYHHIWKNGFDAAIAKIAEADARTVERASAARAALKSCRDLGKRWDQSTGNCS